MAPESVKLDNFGTVTREDSVPSTISEIQRPQKSRFATFWKISHAQARQDLKRRGWKGAFWTLCYLLYFGLIYTFSALATLSSPGSIITNNLTACAPDGSLYTNPAEFSFWRASGVFQVTLGSGHMTFAQAKVVDVVWDVVFGRGGQALLTFLSWKVFTQYVTTSMQVSPVTFSTFRTIFVQGEASALGVWRLIADFSRRRGLQSRLAMVFVVATMVFILAFPVLASAMTGYSANVEPFVRGEGAEYVPFEKLRALYFVVHDGERIGLGKGEKVMDSRFGSGCELKSCWCADVVWG
jgi:succinate dehydrogenase hydrophobic anchor subunit